MGTRIHDIVDVTITRETARVLQAGFGVAMILGEHYHFEDRVRTYTDPADMLEDGFLETDAQYKAAVALMSQALSPEEFKIGRKLANVNAKQKFTFSDTPDSGSFKITLGAETTGAIGYNAAPADIKSALEVLTAVSEVTVSGTISPTGFTIEFTGVDGNKPWGKMSVSDNLLLKGSTPVTGTVSVLQYGSAVETWTSALNSVLTSDEDWYCLLATTRSKADILALAGVIETKEKIYIYATADSDVKTSATDDVASALKSLKFDRTAGIWSSDVSSYPDAAWAGGELPKNPGSSTWKFKTLVGVTADTLTASEIGYMDSKNISYYEEVGGNSIVTGKAVVASGEYIDIIRGIDWLHARIGEDIFAVFIAANKVPYTNAGVSLITAPLRARLLNAASPQVGLIVEDTIAISEPNVDDALPADKAVRLLKGISFSAQLQGAVHKVEISGKLSL